MSQVFKDFDLSSVWESDSWADENYKEAPFTPEILAAVEVNWAINCRKVLLN